MATVTKNSGPIGGGAGGTVVSNNNWICPANSHITKIFGRASAGIDQLGIACSDGTTFKAAGGDGGVSFTKNSNWGYNAVNGKYDAAIIRSADFTSVDTGSSAGKIGGDAAYGDPGETYNFNCGGEDVLVGLQLRTGYHKPFHLVDQVDYKCGPAHQPDKKSCCMGQGNSTECHLW